MDKIIGITMTKALGKGGFNHEQRVLVKTEGKPILGV